MGISVKVHDSGEGRIIAACDKELLGRRYSEGELRLWVNPDFYAGEAVSAEDLLRLLEGCMSANLVGEESVNAFCDKNPGHRGAVIRVGGIPHIQIFRI